MPRTRKAEGAEAEEDTGWSAEERYWKEAAKVEQDHGRGHASKTTRLAQELEFVADFLIVDDMFAGGHDGDVHRVVAGFVQLGPLLLEAAKPNKAEEHLSHMMRLAMMSQREYILMTRRNLFHTYRGGEKAVDVTPEYDQHGISLSTRRTVFNDENGEDFIGRLKVSRAYSEAQLIRRSKLFNPLERQRTLTYRKRHKSSSVAHMKDTDHLISIVSLLHQLDLRNIKSIRARTSQRALAAQALGGMLARRQTSQRRPIEHRNDGKVAISFRQMVANLRADNAEPKLPGSAQDWIDHDFDPKYLRKTPSAAQQQNNQKGAKVDWWKKLVEEVNFFVCRSGVDWRDGPAGDFNNFGKRSAEVRRYVGQARGKGSTAGALVGSKKDLQELMTEKFMHETPLGSATVSPHVLALDPFAVVTPRLAAAPALQPAPAPAAAPSVAAPAAGDVVPMEGVNDAVGDGWEVDDGTVRDYGAAANAAPEDEFRDMTSVIIASM